MKIISQSTVAHRPPYFHLAYLAATHTVPAGSLLGVGVLTLLLGCVLSLRFVRRNATGKRAGPVALALRNGSPRSLVWGLVSLAAGATIVLLSYQAGKTRYVYPEDLTRLRMYFLSDHIEERSAEGEPIPGDLPTLAVQWGLSQSEIQDAWSLEMRLTKTTVKEGTEYGLVSAGKDRRFGTGDDLVLAIPKQQKESEPEI